MKRIQVLDQITIDKIAAGEVIERPASVVKELVENAIDAEATAITVEIQEGGISLIRITDNGSGIEPEEIRSAFLRHSTSKIRSVEDLAQIDSLGFRGEALSSIAAVAQVEVLTKSRERKFGCRYRISGGCEQGLEDAAAPDGTTFLVRQIFYNTPARRKFLRTPMTEASHVGDLMTRMALSHPAISFHFINNGQSKLHTSGNGNLRDVIYHVYGREIATNLLAAEYASSGIKIGGFLGKPLVSRGNRNYENYFINGRYVKSNLIAKAIEDAYKDFSMQHKYPFVALQVQISGEDIDVNVHPTKMELRFQNQQAVYNAFYEAVSRGLHAEELIPHVEVEVPRTESVRPAAAPPIPPQSSSQMPSQTSSQAPPKLPPKEERDLDYFMEQMRKRVAAYHEQGAAKQDPNPNPNPNQNQNPAPVSVPDRVAERPEAAYGQLNLFEERLLAQESLKQHRIIGQVFETYWLIEFQDSLYIIDQHAAHERVLYEKTLRGMKERQFTSQMISPPIVLELRMQEAQLLRENMDRFTRIGFEFEEFGEESFAVRAVPDNLFHIAKKELLLQMLDDLSDECSRNLSPEILDEKIASMSCKAAVKGKMHLSFAEVDALIGELLTLENPYHCPHGRPTIISMTKRELEKKFKRIV